MKRSNHRASPLILLLCTLLITVEVFAQEGPRDSGSLIKPPTIKPPTATATAGKTNTLRGRRRKRRVRRVRRKVASTRTTKNRVLSKPREVQGVIVDAADSNPSSAAVSAVAPVTPATPKRPKAPISGGVLNGRATSLPLPVYPAIAKAAHASGTVVVRVLIDEDGNVVEAQAISGHALLHRAAEDAARMARFMPTRLSGEPVKVTGVITFNFVLD